MASNIFHTAVDCAATFFKKIFRRRGIPDSIVSDRGPKFTLLFWSTLTELCDLKLWMSSSDHLQANCSSEIMIRGFENYIPYCCPLFRLCETNYCHQAGSLYSSSQLNTTGYTSIWLDIGWTPLSALDTIGFKLGTNVAIVDVLRDSRDLDVPDERRYVCAWNGTSSTECSHFSKEMSTHV